MEKSASDDKRDARPRIRRGLVIVLGTAALVMAALVSVIAINGRTGSSVPLGRTGPIDSGPIDSSARPSPSPLANDGWFVEPADMQVTANDVITDADLLPLYVDGELADAVVAAGLRKVRNRSYRIGVGATFSGSVRVIDVDDPSALLDAIDLADPYPDLPRGRMSSGRLQVESTRGHDVWFHYRQIAFFSDPYVVHVSTNANTADAAQRRALEFARGQHELLQSRAVDENGR